MFLSQQNTNGIWYRKFSDAQNNTGMAVLPEDSSTAGR